MKSFGFQKQDFRYLTLLGLLPLGVFAGNSTIPPRRSPDQVLLVVNENSPVSKEIAGDYARQRLIRNLLSIQCQDSALSANNETIPLAAYTQFIESPVRGFLAAHTNIDFIVLTKGIPLRITGAAMGSCDQNSQEPENTRGHPSVDSYLSALDYTNISAAVKIHLTGSGAIGCAYSNRFWRCARSPFPMRNSAGQLVTRLDGYDVVDAKALVTRSLVAEQDMTRLLTRGKVLLDVEPAFGLVIKRRNRPRSAARIFWRSRPGANSTRICATPTMS